MRSVTTLLAVKQLYVLPKQSVMTPKQSVMTAITKARERGQETT